MRKIPWVYVFFYLALGMIVGEIIFLTKGVLPALVFGGVTLALGVSVFYLRYQEPCTGCQSRATWREEVGTPRDGMVDISTYRMCLWCKRREEIGKKRITEEEYLRSSTSFSSIT